MNSGILLLPIYMSHWYLAPLLFTDTKALENEMKCVLLEDCDFTITTDTNAEAIPTQLTANIPIPILIILLLNSIVEGLLVCWNDDGGFHFVATYQLPVYCFHMYDWFDAHPVYLPI